jgi:hypothetical protein
VSAKIEFKGADAIARKLAAMDKKARGRAAREIGRDVARVVQPIYKAETRRVTGGLQRATGSKVKVYRNGAVVVIVVGPRTSVAYQRVNPRKVRRIKKGESVAGFKQSGTYYRPSRIAHLAGKGRKSKTLPRTVSRARGPVQAVFIRHMKALPNA